jgi:hypothetical protein
MIKEIIYIFLIAWFITKFAPLHSVLNILIERTRNNVIEFCLSLVSSILSCQKCSAFWVGLIVFQNPSAALIASFSSYMFEYVLVKIDNKYD